MMIRKVYILFLIGCPLITYGQLGGNVKYLFGQSEYLNEVNLSQDGIQFSLEYGFRLKEKRLEFHPGIGYRTTIQNDTYDGFFRSVDLDLNTSIYPFDFGGDCDCPTFSKDGHLIKKGFFLEISPGLGYQTLSRENYDAAPFDPVPVKSSEFVIKLGAGAGLDIGLNEEWTITPMFSWTKIFPREWDGLNEYGMKDTLEDQTYLAAGLRVAYKPDDRRRRRY